MPKIQPGSTPEISLSKSPQEMTESFTLTTSPSPGKERDFEGIVDVLGARCVYFEGAAGENVVYKDLPTSMEGEIIERRNELIECLSNVDEELGERCVYPNS